MPYIQGGLALGGAAASYFNSQGGSKAKTRSFQQSVFQPQLIAFLQAGGDLKDLIASKVPKGRKPGSKGASSAYGIAGKAVADSFGVGQRDKKTGRYKRGLYLSDGTRVRKADTIKFGGNRIAIHTDRARDLFKKQFDIAQKQQIDQTQKNFDLLFGKDGPQFLRDKITNRPEQLREAYGPAVTRGLQRALGGAAPAGTLTTDALLQRVSAPLAFQAESMFQQAEDVRNAQQLGLSGVPGFGQGFSADPNNFNAPQGREYLQGLGLNVFAGNQGANLANAQFSNQRQGFQSGLLASGGAGLGSIFGSA